jgi:hypothetical protein
MVWRTNCVYNSGTHKIGSLVSDIVLHKLCNKKLKYITFLKRYIGVHHFTNASPVNVWLFLELLDTIHLLVTSEHVFVAAP